MSIPLVKGAQRHFAGFKTEFLIIAGIAEDKNRLGDDCLLAQCIAQEFRTDSLTLHLRLDSKGEVKVAGTGEHRIEVRAQDPWGDWSQAARVYRLDTRAP